MTGTGNRGELSRRRFVEALSAAGVAGAFAGCTGDGGGSANGSGEGGANGSGGNADGSSNESSGNSGSATTVQLSGWAANNEESAFLQEVVGQFDENHEDITVDYDAIQSKYKQKLKTQLGAGNAPDTFYVKGEYFSSFASQDVLLELTSVAEGEGFDTDDFFQPILDAFRYDGTLYGIPKGFSTLQLYTNSTLWEEAGASEPKSWDDLRSGLEAVKSSTDVKAPMILQPNARAWYGLVFQNGGQILNDERDEAVFASKAGVEALEFLAGLKRDGLAAIPSDISASWQGAALGQKSVAAGITGPWAIPFLKAEHPDVNENTTVSHIPTPSGGTKATPAYTVSYSVSSNTDAPDASKTLVSYLTGKEGMKQWASKGIELSARKSHGDMQFYKENPRYKTHYEAGEWSKVVGYGVNSAAILNLLNPQLEAVMVGEKDPKPALETAQEKVNTEVLS
ncbi:ABC transporter substrate-binding protein [Halobium salinum]|uniref:ABC transporter substrate-binding protein n=1 Tax=Halobium salinum TaxID=1364940 RepID=A0ABD5P9T2_9EURY|nr:ABC transporter substrate-binding protein [Halobium salinum]